VTDDVELRCAGAGGTDRLEDAIGEVRAEVDEVRRRKIRVGRAQLLEGDDGDVRVPVRDEQTAALRDPLPAVGEFVGDARNEKEMAIEFSRMRFEVAEPVLRFHSQLGGCLRHLVSQSR
jgi:hypothetical protein